MSIEEVAAALEDWVAETCPGITTTYDHEPKALMELPEVSTILGEITYADAPEAVGSTIGQQIEQGRYVVYAAALVILVDPEDPAAADASLKGFAQALADAAEIDRTFGGRGLTLARQYSFDFHPDAPFLQFDDGARTRRMTMDLVAVRAVADQT